MEMDGAWSMQSMESMERMGSMEMEETTLVTTKPFTFIGYDITISPDRRHVTLSANNPNADIIAEG
jgi:hypothetical protein